MNEEDRNRVLVIGLDGATLDLIMPLARSGLLPNLSNFMEEGAFGELISSIPPLTPPAWVSFMTGCNSGKHGIFGFTHRSLNYIKDPQGSLVSSRSIRTRTLWEILTHQGKEMVIINVPLTYPPSKIKGIMISGLMAPDEKSDFLYPPHLREILFEQLGGYRVDDNPLWSDITDRKRCLKEYLEIEEKRHCAVRYFLEKHPWDLFVVVYSLLDRVQHLTWQFQNDDSPENRDLAQAISNAYQRQDQMVGDLVSQVDKNTTVFIISDHGFGPLKKVFYTNKWLLDKGFLQLKRPALFNFFRLYRWEVAQPTLTRLLSRLKFGFLNSLLPSSLKDKRIRVPRLRKGSPLSLVDWSRTKAYASNHGIYINLKGREERGTVKLGKEYQELIGLIASRLKELRDPETKEKIVDLILRREDIYSGPFMGMAPELTFMLKKMTYLQNDSFEFDRLFSLKNVGTHRMEGIFFAKGNNIRKGVNLKGCKILDIAPTILYLFDLPIPEMMDGKILTECLTPELLKGRIPKISTAPLFISREEEERVFSTEEEEKIKKGLQGLGYLE